MLNSFLSILLILLLRKRAGISEEPTEVFPHAVGSVRGQSGRQAGRLSYEG